jgi:hypothetical protein
MRGERWPDWIMFALLVVIGVCAIIIVVDASFS